MSGPPSAVRRPLSELAKRAFDLLVVLMAAPLWVPVLAIVALLVRLKLGAPVFSARSARAAGHGFSR